MRFLLVFVAAFLLSGAASSNEVFKDISSWKEVKSTHFVLRFQDRSQESAAKIILNRAQEIYSKALDRLGASKIGNFWTWEERVKIIYFASQKDFIEATGQPKWSRGMSLSHATGFQARMIVSYQGQDEFLENILPHEVSHLVLHDFMGGAKIPRWFDEGIAQLDEENNDPSQRKVMASLVRQNKVIPFSALEMFPSMINQDPTTAAIFYAESLYIVDFLIKTYGKDKFALLCRFLRAGKSFEEALVKVYYPTITSLKSLEEKWTLSMLVSK